MLIALRIKSAEALIAPVAEGRPLIVDEESSKSDRRLLRGIFIFCRDRKRSFLLRHDIQPVDKRRHAQFLRQGEQAIYCSAFVGSGDHERGCFLRKKKSRGEFPDHLVLIDFSFPVHIMERQKSCRLELCKYVTSDGPYQDRVSDPT